MRKSYLLITLLFAMCSCLDNDPPETEEIQENCLGSDIPCPVIIGQENTGCAVNIIFLAEGFTESEMPEFRELAGLAKQAILDMEPFASAANSLNFYRVESPSVTSGIKTKQYTSVCNGTTGEDTFSETPWGVFGNRVGLGHYAGMEPEKRDLLEELYGDYATGDYAYTIIIANTTGRYGGAEFPGVTEYNTIARPRVSNMIVSKHKAGEEFKYLIRHEFGHSFGNLDDEYEDSKYHCAVQHEAWFLPETPKLNVLTYNPGSWFEGARYVRTGYWREWENSIMRANRSLTEFSPVQRSIVENRLAEAIGCP